MGKKRTKKVDQLAERRLKKVFAARDNLLDFTQLQHPSAENPDDADLSRYVIAHHHKLIAHELELLEAGVTPRLIIEAPPRHGKSVLASEMFPAWCMGRNPSNQIILASYNEKIARKFGRKFKHLLQAPAYKQVFPYCEIEKAAKSSELAETTSGGVALYSGRGGTLTGFGAHILLIDDPIKGREESRSKRVMDDLWEWYWSDAHSRLMTGGRVCIIMTRWSHDDLVGRLTDPTNDYYRESEARKWKKITLPALIDNPRTGEKESVPLWPKRSYPGGLVLGRTYEELAAIRDIDKRTFYSLYQQQPSIEDGEYFLREMIVTYQVKDRPKLEDMRIYAASDFAVSEREEADYTVMVVVGVDKDDHVWVLDMWRDRKNSETVVEAMLQMMRRWKPIVWWAEGGHISKSLGPFLRKRMYETKTYINVREVTPVRDKQARAQSIQGRMSMRMVHFPEFLPGYNDIVDELLKFPNGIHDDIVDTLAHIGMGLDSLVGASEVRKTDNLVIPKSGTLAWVKWQTKQQEKEAAMLQAIGDS